MDKPRWLERVLSYISQHSTNMWLTHMFFYMIYFKALVYAPKYPLFIFIWLVTICIVTSYGINFIYKFLLNIIDLRLLNNKEKSMMREINN